MRKYIAILLIGIASGVIGMYFFISGKPKMHIITETQYPTIYKYKEIGEYNPENFKLLKACYESPLIMDSSMLNDNTIRVTAADDCKSSQLDIEIGSRGDWKIYAGIGITGAAVGGYCVYKILK
jgi:hypothetical protein